VPAVHVFEICLDPIRQIGFARCFPAKTPDLRQAGQAGLYRVPIPIALVNGPQQSISGASSQGMWPRSNYAHLPPKDVYQLGKFIKARAAKQPPDPRNAFIVFAD